MPKALKTCPKSNKSLNLVTLVTSQKIFVQPFFKYRTWNLFNITHTLYTVKWFFWIDALKCVYPIWAYVKVISFGVISVSWHVPFPYCLVLFSKCVLRLHLILNRRILPNRMKRFSTLSDVMKGILPSASSSSSWQRNVADERVESERDIKWSNFSL